MYGTSFYGSVLWNLNSEEHNKLLRSWNVAVKLIWDLPYNAHTRFIESITDCPHLQSVLHSRYVGFAKSLSSSNKKHIQVLYSLCKDNLSTLTGYNLKNLMLKYDCVNHSILFEKQAEISNTRVNELPQEEFWKVPLLQDLIGIRNEDLECDLTSEEIEDLIKFVTTA